MLVVNHLRKNYKKVEAVKGISFTVKPGEGTILLGPNGAGKSTTIKAISGLLKYEGNITLNGLANGSLAARRQFSYVPEVAQVFHYLTVREHIEFMAKAYGISGSEADAERYMEMFELTDKQHKLGKTLSKGMQQKVSIVCGLIVNPAYILFDEPLVGLDPKAIRTLKGVFESLREKACGVLISTHIIETLDDLWDNVIVMQNGAIKLQTGRAAFLENYPGRTLEEVFFELTEAARSGEA